MRHVVSLDILEKGMARGGKYYRRVATGNPKRPYRYYYTREQYEKEHGDKAHVSGAEKQQSVQDEKRKQYLAKMAGTVESFQAALSSGKLKGTLGQHVKIAKKTIEAHNKTLSALMDDLKSFAPKGAKVKARVKTIESALGKLVRKPKYGTVANLQDATGARVVCSSIAEVQSTVANLKKKYRVVTEDDYISKDLDGYRSHHLIIEHEGQQKEIQIRTKNQDVYAEFAHDIYKPMTPAQEQAIQAEGGTIKKYSAQLSDFIYAKDLGKEPPPPPRPDCPPVVEKTFGGCPSV